MKRTRVTTLILVTVLGAAIAAITQQALASSGRPIIPLPITLAVALAIIGALVVTLAVPIRRMTRATDAPRVDPFYATRIVMLAKASAITGALGVGVALGALLYLFTRTVISVDTVVPVVSTLVGAGVLLAGGLVAEHMCRIPPTDDDNESGKDAVQA